MLQQAAFHKRKGMVQQLHEKSFALIFIQGRPATTSLQASKAENWQCFFDALVHRVNPLQREPQLSLKPYHSKR